MTASLNHRREPCFVSDHAQDMMVALWFNGKDTREIANLLSFHESDVYNRLPLLRARHKQMQAVRNGMD